MWVVLLLLSASCITELNLAAADASTGAIEPNKSPVSSTSAPGHGKEQQSLAAVCGKWGLQPAAVGAEPPRVFDFFLAGHEYDMMEIRLGETHRELDHIFILESRQTHSGKPKPLAYPHVIPRLHADIIRKIHYTVLETLKGDSSWEKENYQRIQLLEAALKSSGIQPRPQDVFLISDLDEIPKPEFMRVMKLCAVPYPASLVSHLHFYSFNYINGAEWNIGPIAMQARQHKQWNAQQLRSGVQGERINYTRFGNASWHCSYCFSHASHFRQKLSSSAHVEFDTPYYHNLTRLVDCLQEGWSIFQGNIGERGAQPEYKRLPKDQVDAPHYIYQHLDRFAYLLNRDGKAGGLVDVDMRSGTAILKQHNHKPSGDHHRQGQTPPIDSPSD